MKHPHALLGALLSAIAFLFFTCFDTATKFVSKDYSVFQIMSVEFVTAIILLLLFAFIEKRSAIAQELRIHKPAIHLWRGLTQVIGQSFVFLAVSHVTLAEFYVVLFCMPMLTALIASITLREHIGRIIWLVMLLNFVGVLIAMRPEHGLSLWALVLLAGAVTLSCSLVLLRKMMQTETTTSGSLTTALSLAIGSIIPTLFLYKPFEVQPFLLMMLGGVFFAFAQKLLTMAYKRAPVAYVGPPQYLQLVYGAVAGYLVFGDVPNIWIYVGGGIVTAANLFLLFMQQRQQQHS